jgi:hypothetical protein
MQMYAVPVLVLELGQELVLVWALASVPVSKPALEWAASLSTTLPVTLSLSPRVY